MSLHPDNTMITIRATLTELVLATLRAFVSALEKTAENNARTQALQAITAMTDDELHAKGLTRAEMIKLTFHHDA